MPLTNPPPLGVIYAECNSPDAGSQPSPGYLFDAWYDKNQDDVTASRDSVLAALGFVYAVDRVTARVLMGVSVTAHLVVDPAPGGACTIVLNEPDYLNSPELAIADPNTLGTQIIGRTFVMRAGQTFDLSSTCANGTDTPLTYAALSIVRLV